MPDASSRLALPYLQPGQAQKELFHNEALTIIDAMLHIAVQSAGDNDPPSTPAPGQCWIVGSSPTGAWAGHGGAIAGWGEGGWRFIAPLEGMLVWLIDDQLWAPRRKRLDCREYSGPVGQRGGRAGARGPAARDQRSERRRDGRYAGAGGLGGPARRGPGRMA